jgi:peroxiredoxin
MVDSKRAARLNEVIRYTAWSVFRARTDADRLPEAGRKAVAEEAEALVEQLAAKDVVVRGSYDVAALRADADLMVWWHAPSADDLLRIVDLMRHLRASTARRHVREEVPFYTGRRKPLRDIVSSLP